MLQKVHEKYVDDALFLMVTHDVNPRAHQPEGEGLRPGAELVPGLLADMDGQVMASGGFADAPGSRLSRASTPC